MPRQLPGTELLATLLAPVEPSFAGDLVVVDGPIEATPNQVARAADLLATLPCVVLGAPGAAVHPLFDAVARDHADLDALVATARRAPTAAAALAVHLRGGDQRSATAGLAAESALYSALQAGPEHRRWREATHRRGSRVEDDVPRVRVERRGDRLDVALTRPAVRNALDARMRDELLDALAVAVADPSLEVDLRGEGEAFCSGGDLDEFGTLDDPASAHVVRLRRSLAAVLRSLARRTTVHLHGACAGSGVELAAFAGRVLAAPDTALLLPELRMGLVRGAGGTVSLPERIGRHATMRLCLLGTPIDVVEAQRLGLVDEVVAEPLAAAVP